jgi:hypothetical protein
VSDLEHFEFQISGLGCSACTNKEGKNISIFKNYMSKGWGRSSSSRAQSSEFKPKYCKKTKVYILDTLF